MGIRRSVVPFFMCIGVIGAEQNVFVEYNRGVSMTPADAASIEIVLASNPEDLSSRTELLGYYGGASSPDPQWTNRYRLLSWLVQYHPESGAAAIPQAWRGMPDPIFEQLKPLWVAEVHQHADDAKVLSNASLFLSSKGSSAIPSSIRVGANVQQANLIQSAEPVYPALAKQARIQGTVRFNVTIGADGHIENIQLVSGHPLLVEAARQAVQQYLYKPTLLNGKPVAVITTVDINFTLPAAGA